jgi:hypothetical protein
MLQQRFAAASMLGEKRDPYAGQDLQLSDADLHGLAQRVKAALVPFQRSTGVSGNLMYSKRLNPSRPYI